MTNHGLFASLSGARAPAAGARNEGSGIAGARREVGKIACSER